jgi:SAM-dependent methyltransferase
MNQVEKSFHDKWHHNPNAFFAETLNEGSETQNWILSRNGYHSLAALILRLETCERILDAGCGNGRVTALLRKCSPSDSKVVGIDLASADVARENFREVINTEFYQRDLLDDDLQDLGVFDFIYCQEVLHHTADPRRAFGNLAKLLSDNKDKRGEIAIYVYKKKAPVREFVDEYIRERLSHLSYDQAIEYNKEITEFGRVLAELEVNVNVPNVRVLEIKEGSYSIQRLIYHFFFKCYWNQALSFIENTVVNYDWYHPILASKHTLEEVRTWFWENNLEIVWEYEDHYGITVRGLRLP